ncbi:MAG: HEAT repeat domain-containing protein [Spirochaetes bacterium]|nr:HEAT repeat domain-containing protein [Spirochaetota bacterium]
MRPSINGVKVPFDKSTQELFAMLDCELPLFYVACEALAYKNDVVSFEKLLSIFQDSDPYKKRIALECLGNHSMFDTATAEKYVFPCLDDSSPYIVRTAIDVLVKHRVAQSHEKIIQLLKSKDEATRECAFFALEHIGKASDFDLILSLYNDKNKRIKNFVPYITLIFADETNWKKAYDLMQRGDHEKARLTACKLLDAFGTETEKGDASHFLHDKSGHVRNYASKMLASFKAVEIEGC